MGKLRHIKSLIFGFCVVLIGVFAFSEEKVEAAEIIHQGTLQETIKWSINDEGKLLISGYGEGVDDGDWPWLEYYDEIISAEVTVSGLKSAKGLFYNCKFLKSVDVSKWDSSTVTDMSEMFYFCDSIETLDLNKLDTSKVVTMHSMFTSCSSLKKIDISAWNTSNVVDMGFMFYKCRQMNEINISAWNTSNVRNMGLMFYECRSLEKLDLNGWNLENIDSMSEMFYMCSNLNQLNIDKWNTGNAYTMTYMFYGCENLEKLNLKKWDTGNLQRITGMFQGCTKLSTAITFSGEIYILNNCFLNAATNDAKIEVTYSGKCTYAMAKAIVDSKSFNSNIVLMNNPGERKILYSGADEEIFWTIDNYGKLTLKGKGDGNYFSNWAGKPDWCSYADEISSVSILVKGMTTVRGLLFDCKFLLDVDTSEWDTSNITDMAYLFGNCESLKEVDVSE